MMVSYNAQLIEEVSDEIHKMWTSWATEILQTEKGISKERRKRWEEDCFKPYKELTEKMKDLDRKYAIKILNRIKSTTS